jgi:large subunit ribosomal protein LP2
MKYVAAYLLANISGKASPSKADLVHILESVGASTDGVDAFLKAVEGKTPAELIKAGTEKLASVPSGAAVAAAPAAGGAVAAAPAAKVAEPEPVEEEEVRMK